MIQKLNDRSKKDKNKSNTRTPFMASILKKVAPKIGAKVIIEPKWGIVCQVTFKSGKRCYFRYNTLDLNYMGSSEIARDKDYSNFFMKKMGYKTIEGKAFFSDKWASVIDSDLDSQKAYKYAKEIGFPVIVKPNSGSQGVGVALVYDGEEFYKALNLIFKDDRVAQVQKFTKGQDYRIVVLDKKVISAYLRIPLSVIGDGKSSIEKLLNNKQQSFVKSGRDTRINFEDERIANKLKHQNLSFNSIVEKGQKVYLLDNANLSTGGDSVDVTNSLHKDWKKIAVNLTRDMGLRLCGVDVLVDGRIDQKPKNYNIIEVNSAPGLDHYATSGYAQQKIVEDLYLEVLRSIEK